MVNQLYHQLEETQDRLNASDEEKIEIYKMIKTKFPENTYTRIAMMRLAEIYQANDCDVVVALGGGSPMDAAKGIALLASNGALILAARLLGSSARLPVVAIQTSSAARKAKPQTPKLVSSASCSRDASTW